MRCPYRGAQGSVPVTRRNEQGAEQGDREVGPGIPCRHALRDRWPVAKRTFGMIPMPVLVLVPAQVRSHHMRKQRAKISGRRWWNPV